MKPFKNVKLFIIKLYIDKEEIERGGDMVQQLRGFYLENQRYDGHENNEELFIKIKSSVNEQEKKDLVSDIFKANIGLLNHLLHKNIFGIEKLLRTYKITYDDLFSIASIGMVKSINTFDVDKKIKFATYCAMVIMNEIRMYFRKYKKSTTDVNLEKSITQDIDGNELRLMDIIPYENDDYSKIEEKEFEQQYLSTFLNSLSPRDKTITQMYFYENKSQMEISQILNMSQSYVSRLVKKICKQGNNLYKRLEKGGDSMKFFPKFKLTPTEAKELLIKAKTGDSQAKQKFIESNLRLAWSIVTKKFMNRGYDPEDLFQIGVIGLIKSVDKFDFSFNVQFSTYAVPMIMGEIQRFLRDNGTIKVSRSAKEIASVIRREKELFFQQKDREPTAQEIADILEMPIEEYAFVIQATKPIRSIHEVIFENDGDPITIMDHVADEGTEKLFDNIMVHEVIEKLEERDRQIIYMRFFQDKTQGEVGKILGISQVQISRCEQNILSKIRKEMGVKLLPPEVEMPKIIVPLEKIQEEEEIIINMAEFKTKREMVFTLLDKRYKKDRIMREAKIASGSYYNYLSLHKKAKENGEWPPKVETQIVVEESKITGPEPSPTPKILLVDIVLVDGTVIENCGIFKSNPDNFFPVPTHGDRPIQNENDIKEAFQKVPWGRKTVYFQTKYMNGYTDAANVKEYEVRLIDEEEAI